MQSHVHNAVRAGGTPGQKAQGTIILSPRVMYADQHPRSLRGNIPNHTLTHSRGPCLPPRRDLPRPPTLGSSGKRRQPGIPNTSHNTSHSISHHAPRQRVIPQPSHPGNARPGKGVRRGFRGGVAV